ncbi:TPA: hypothetical protein ACNH8R_000037 [Pseudomonas aeruginosa]
MQPKEPRRMDATTKARRETIGVTTKTSLLAAVNSLAEQRGVPTAELTRELLQSGFDRFEDESESANPSRLLRTYEQEARSFDGCETRQWMIRADRRLVMSVRLRAKEYEKSTSFIASCFLANALRHEAPASMAASSVEHNAASLQKTLDVLKTVRGVKSKGLAEALDLATHRPLVTQILNGSVTAPARVLERVASYLRVPLDSLKSAVSYCFQTQTVASFNATEKKPEMLSQPLSWEAAVKDLKIPEKKEEKRLLDMAS